MKVSHCSECGTPYAQTSTWPRVCPNKPACGALAWQNPRPVVVVLQPVTQERENGALDYGALIAKRAIWPKKGEWSLISGYINVDENETAEDAARREFREETSLEIKGDPVYVGSAQNANGILMLFFVASLTMTAEEARKAVPCEENEAIAIKWDDSDLCFPLQSQLYRGWKANGYRARPW